MYKKSIKRLLDFFLSLIALIVLSPIFLILILMGIVEMKGNPFFSQKRPGKNEKIFSLIKFRSMTNEKDKNGVLLPNEKRLNKYGRILRKTSLDELPELINILIGDMSIVGPRPLLPEYIPYYTEEEHHRHDVRPGLTGLAQVNGRNAIGSWEERFGYDLQYVKECSFLLDMKIIWQTVMKVVKRADILDGNNVVVGRLDEVRKKQ
jgi:undecaprenyl phosphate N,N'-diacetylbacillosamine 1-phosphate transferase